jgi:hypothetical protein
LTATNTTDLANAVSNGVLAALALLAALFALWWWFQRLQIKPLIDRENTVRVWLANKGRQPRQVVGVQLIAVPARLVEPPRLPTDANTPLREVVVSEEPEEFEPFTLNQGEAKVLWFRDARKSLPLPPTDWGRATLAVREPEIQELRIAVVYGDGKRVRIGLKQAAGYLRA